MAEKETNILKSLSDYILDIDFMTTNEFCLAYKVPMPYFTGDVKTSVDLILQIDAIKQRMFVEYAKFLNKELCMEMFEGDRKIFEGGQYIDRQPSHDWNTYEIKDVVIFMDSNKGQNRPIGKRVSDLTGKGLTYSRLWV